MKPFLSIDAKVLLFNFNTLLNKGNDRKTSVQH